MSGSFDVLPSLSTVIFYFEEGFPSSWPSRDKPLLGPLSRFRRTNLWVFFIPSTLFNRGLMIPRQLSTSVRCKRLRLWIGSIWPSCHAYRPLVNTHTHTNFTSIYTSFKDLPTPFFFYYKREVPSLPYTISPVKINKRSNVWRGKRKGNRTWWRQYWFVLYESEIYLSSLTFVLSMFQNFLTR